MELMLTTVQSGHNLSDLVITQTESALFFAKGFYFEFGEWVDQFGWQAFADHADFLLQLEELLVGHLVGVDAVFVFSLESHWHYEIRDVLCLTWDPVIQGFSVPLVSLANCL